MASGPEPTIPISQADDIVWNNTKEIIALKEYTDQYISLYQGEIRNVGYELANRLIEQGIVAEHDETGSGEGSSSGSSSGAFVATFNITQDEDESENIIDVVTCDKTVAEIKTAYQSGATIIADVIMYGTVPTIRSFMQINLNEEYDDTYQVNIINIFYNRSSATSGEVIVNDILSKATIYWDSDLNKWDVKFYSYRLQPIN